MVFLSKSHHFGIEDTGQGLASGASPPRALGEPPRCWENTGVDKEIMYSKRKILDSHMKIMDLDRIMMSCFVFVSSLNLYGMWFVICWVCRSSQRFTSGNTIISLLKAFVGTCDMLGWSRLSRVYSWPKSNVFLSKTIMFLFRAIIVL